MNEGASAFDVGIRRSRLLLGTLGACHALAGVSLLLADLHPLMRGALSCAILLSGYDCLIHHCLLCGPRSIVGLRWRDDGWSVRLRDGEWLYVEPVGAQVVTLTVMVLRFRTPGARSGFSLVLFPDSCAKDALRRLRVRLRFGADPA